MIGGRTDRPAHASWRVGVIATGALTAIYAIVALVVEVPRDTGIFSDEATYYAMAHSLASDGDLAYRAEDIRRAKREIPGGPAGIFLKPGRDVTGLRLSAVPPFFEIEGLPDRDRSRLFFGKSFIYPVFAAPFVWLLGTNGFLWLNALLLGSAFLAAYTFLGARSGTRASLLLAGAFVMATVVPVYTVWMMPELFNFTLGVLAYFFWLYKHVAKTAPGRWTAWLRGPASDLAAGVLLGLATFSKITNGLLAVPLVAWLLWRREIRQAALVALVVGGVTAGLFAVNVAVTGDWNYQGRPRNTFYGRYPFEAPDVGFDAGTEMARDEPLTDVIFDPEMFWPNLRANLVYLVVGRYGGLLPYFFPALLAFASFLTARGRRQSFQWFVLGGVVAHILLFIITQPYTYLGSGGSVGNRYFMGAYGACVFLFPPTPPIAGALAAWAVGTIFVGKIVLHPFVSSLRPFDPAKSGPLRMLPVELTNLNGLPIMNESHRVRVPYGDTGAGDPDFQIYHLDDNAYLPEADRKSFWVRGKSRAEMVFKTDEIYSQAVLQLTAGLVGTDASVTVGGHSARVTLGSGETTELRLALGVPFKYKFYPAPNYIWVISISSSEGFRPPPNTATGQRDDRFLGVRVKPMLLP